MSRKIIEMKFLNINQLKCKLININKGISACP